MGATVLRDGKEVVTVTVTVIPHRDKSFGGGDRLVRVEVFHKCLGECYIATANDPSLMRVAPKRRGGYGLIFRNGQIRLSVKFTQIGIRAREKISATEGGDVIQVL